MTSAPRLVVADDDDLPDATDCTGESVERIRARIVTYDVWISELEQSGDTTLVPLLQRTRARLLDDLAARAADVAASIPAAPAAPVPAWTPLLATEQDLRDVLGPPASESERQIPPSSPGARITPHEATGTRVLAFRTVTTRRAAS